MLALLVFLALALLLILAVKVKVGNYRSNNVEAVASPVSRALAELVAIAGGIYLSLVLLVSFLKISLPETIAIGGFLVDPLAVVALVIALIQPLILGLWPRLKGR
ncbi:MAG: hypothetical protein IMW95_01580 [Moorella humiferrea]|uniref:Uncharacterized protein n=1 Tax=Neomoorella humiferrea TaxID=676965 RepID=A0A2T0AND2_9FIRM|nr:hypothetical protein [Moorella humiferrea]MBE3571632.1 hypothetical protein [Moorella humiferrea]PRR70467.1 hypothetical protein MOHU_18830 [Moorella humiferrea]